MTKNELFQKLELFYAPGQGITTNVYAILKDDNTPRLIDIEDESLPQLQQMFFDSIREAVLGQNDLSVLPLSSSDERTNVIYEYDIEIPEELAAIKTVLEEEDIETFNVGEDGFNNVAALLIEIGNESSQLVLYKKMAPIHYFSQTQFFLKKKSQERFEKIKDDFIRISSGFHLMQVAETLFVVELKLLEKFFGFHEIIKKEAQKGLDAIKEIALIENPELYEEMLDDVSFARKLTKIAKDSPVLKKKIPNVEIIKFSKQHPALKGKLRFNADESQIKLDTQVSKNLVIKLLNDDYLTSELTKQFYDSKVKDGLALTTEVNNEEQVQN